MAPLAARLASAQRVTRGEGRIRVTDLEARWGLRLTATTLDRLRLRFPHVNFVWLMGADNLVQLPGWHRWREIMEGTAIAVFDRAPYSKGALVGLAARRYARNRIPARAARNLAGRTPPCWVFLPIRKHAASATAIRARGWDVFGRDSTNGEDNT
jgi:nicotinate-nucleotide adenylyltransferase